MITIIYKKTTIIWLLLATMLFSCKKFLQVSAPVTSMNSQNVYASDATAAAVLTGIYTTLAGSSITNGLPAISFYAGMSADEFTLFAAANNPTYTAYYTNSLNNSNTGSADFWNNIYTLIFTCNSAIQGLNGSTGLTPSVKSQLLGEAYFIRSWCYFYLTNLYGDVPLVTSTDPAVNTAIKRSPQDQVWQFIIQDLHNAEGLLSKSFLNGTIIAVTTERLRPTYWAAEALLARSFLFTQQWDSAELHSSNVLINTGQFQLDSLNGVFLLNSTEAIWQLQPVIQGYNTQEAVLFTILSSGPNGAQAVYISNYLLNSFETGDLRRSNWIDSVIAGGTTFYFPYKYKNALYGNPVTEYQMVFRLGEQYLIRAEARAQQGNTSGAIADLNSIRLRAGLTDYGGSSAQAPLLSAILHERQVELFTEWGQRWLDLKRTGSIDSVMGSPGNVCAAKGGVWSDNWQLYPISLYELQHNPLLVQNTGY